VEAVHTWALIRLTKGVNAQGYLDRLRHKRSPTAVAALLDEIVACRANLALRPVSPAGRGATHARSVLLAAIRQT
jgi:hypothetical protein